MVGYVNRYTKVFEVVKAMIDSALIGNIYDYQCSMSGSVVHNGSRETWRSSTRMGGWMSLIMARIVSIWPFLWGNCKCY